MTMPGDLLADRKAGPEFVLRVFSDIYRETVDEALLVCDLLGRLRSRDPAEARHRPSAATSLGLAAGTVDRVENSLRTEFCRLGRWSS
jgi:hypothetical protein